MSRYPSELELLEQAYACLYLMDTYKSIDIEVSREYGRELNKLKKKLKFLYRNADKGIDTTEYTSTLKYQCSDTTPTEDVSLCLRSHLEGAFRC